ncbi:hypothetical protein LXL04_007013 [Taraxacum kok-saghyz]
MMRLRVKNQINDGSPASTASTNQNTSRGVESAITMVRFSIGEDDEDAPLANKRPRFGEPASQSQPPVVAGEEEEEEMIPIEDVESDTEGSEEEEDDEDDESEAVEEDDEEEEDAGSEEDVVQFTDVQPERQNRPVVLSNIPSSNITDQIRSCFTAPPVFNNATGALHVVLTDPDVLDCPICLDPLSTPVFQCENGHIACSSCCTKVKRKCPSCCMPIGYNRCRAIEKVLESIKISCKNSRSGCKETIPYSKKIDHEETCPHTTCSCPHSLCDYSASSKSLYLHFAIQHASSITRFTYNTTFTLPIELNQKHIFLQEQRESVIFILKHEVKQNSRRFNLDCVGPNSLKTCFSYQLTSKSLETSLSLQSVPEIHVMWFEHSPKKNYLTVPSDFAVLNGILNLNVCIKKDRRLATGCAVTIPKPPSNTLDSVSPVTLTMDQHTSPPPSSSTTIELQNRVSSSNDATSGSVFLLLVNQVFIVLIDEIASFRKQLRFPRRRFLSFTDLIDVHDANNEFQEAMNIRLFLSFTDLINAVEDDDLAAGNAISSRGTPPLSNAGRFRVEGRWISNAEERSVVEESNVERLKNFPSFPAKHKPHITKIGAEESSRKNCCSVEEEPSGESIDGDGEAEVAEGKNGHSGEVGAGKRVPGRFRHAEKTPNGSSPKMRKAAEQRTRMGSSFNGWSEARWRHLRQRLEKVAGGGGRWHVIVVSRDIEKSIDNFYNEYKENLDNTESKVSSQTRASQDAVDFNDDNDFL